VGIMLSAHLLGAHREPVFPLGARAARGEIGPSAQPRLKRKRECGDDGKTRETGLADGQGSESSGRAHPWTVPSRGSPRASKSHTQRVIWSGCPPSWWPSAVRWAQAHIGACFCLCARLEIDTEEKIGGGSSHLKATESKFGCGNSSSSLICPEDIARGRIEEVVPPPHGNCHLLKTPPPSFSKLMTSMDLRCRW
jgi:hypothetical protein